MSDHILFSEDAQKFVKTEQKEMTKQETAEWLAENLMGYKVCSCGHISYQNKHYKPEHEYWNEVEQFIFSPDGLIAVIKAAAAAENLSTNRLALIVEAWKNFWSNQDYQAFYNTVYEAMKEAK